MINIALLYIEYLSNNRCTCPDAYDVFYKELNTLIEKLRAYAQWKPAILVPPDNSSTKERMHWFRNLKPNEPFDKGEIPLDYSLQLGVGLRNFFVEKERSRVFLKGAGLTLNVPDPELHYNPVMR